MKRILLALLVLGALAATPAFSATLDFNSGVPAGMSLGGNMTWNPTGGGHLYMEQYFDDDFIYFSSPTTVNSFEFNSNPWENYGYPTGGGPYLVDVAAFDSSNNQLWSTTVDLAGYYAWNQWKTVTVNTTNVSTMKFFSPANTHGVGFWPSIDNMVVDEPTNAVPEPAGLMLLGIGLAGLAGMRKRLTR